MGILQKAKMETSAHSIAGISFNIIFAWLIISLGFAIGCRHLSARAFL